MTAWSDAVTGGLPLQVALLSVAALLDFTLPLSVAALVRLQWAE